MITVTGKGHCSATILAHSISPKGIQITSFELEYQRFIHSEVMTHRMLTKNAASSRAIPIAAMHDSIRQKTARPVFWGMNQPGMQADQEMDDLTKQSAALVWDAARDSMLAHSTVLSQMKAHKQIANRITEPFQMMKTVMTGTELANFFWLRHHKDAQPEFYELAELMQKALALSQPVELYPGEWHVPYVTTKRDSHGTLLYSDSSNTTLSAHEARMVSASCCAQTSYRKNDDSVDKSQKVFKRLIESQPIHASPVEHQATPMQDPAFLDSMLVMPGRWEEGVTHMDRSQQLWSGNFKGWIQHRKLIPGEAVW